MPSKPKPSAVVFAKEIERIADFYRIVLGLSAIYSDKDHVVLDGDGFQLVIHGILKEIAVTIEIKTPPSVREEIPIKICFPVESIHASRDKADKLGGQVRPKRMSGRLVAFVPVTVSTLKVTSFRYAKVQTNPSLNWDAMPLSSNAISPNKEYK